MLTWVIIFFILAIIASVFGFTGVAAGAAGIAKVLFGLFLILFVISLIMHFADGGRAPNLLGNIQEVSFENIDQLKQFF